jgi:ABC-2 type transport system permease protein
MSELVAHTLFVARRLLRNLLRQPWFIVAMLALPIVSLLLSSSLFSRVASLPGFGWESYISFVAPGMVVMGALLAGGWSGIGVLGDIERGVTDRLLVTPMRRGALVGGRLVQVSVLVLVQSVILVVLAEIRGAGFENGPLGVLLLLTVSVLLAVPVAALSIGLALATRMYETLVGCISVLVLPLILLSTLLMPETLVPHWILSVAAYNPVDWAVRVGRGVVASDPDWSAIGRRIGGLLVLGVVATALAVRAIRSYLRAV